MGKYGNYLAAGEVTVAKFKSVFSAGQNKFYEKVYIPRIGDKQLKVFHTTKSGALQYGKKVRNRYLNKLSLLIKDIENG